MTKKHKVANNGPRVSAPKLSKEARAARTPRPPEELVEALHDRIHPTSGSLLSAKPLLRKNLHIEIRRK